jgi:prolyl oligopeptidase
MFHPRSMLALAAGAALAVSCGGSDEKPDDKPTHASEASVKPAGEQQSAAAPAPAPKGFQYPDARRMDHTDDYHGTVVADPYRWLEDPDSAETKAWVTAENKVTFGYLEQIPVREELKKRLTELWNFERYSSPWKEGKSYFYFKNDGLQNQDVLYTLATLEAEPRVLLDPNALSDDGTIALTNMAFSHDGKKMAYALSEGGSDWRTWKVLDVESGETAADEVKWSKFSNASWTKDGKGFFYARYPEPKKGEALEDSNYFHKVYFHTLGTEQSSDELIFEDKEHKERGFEPYVTEDGKYLVLHVWKGTDTKNRLYYKDLSKPGAKVVKLLDDFDAAYEFIGNVGSTFYIKTDKDAPKSKVIAIDLKRPNPQRWKTIVAEGEDKLEGAQLINSGLLLRHLKNAHDQVSFADLKGKQTWTLELPTLGSVGGFAGKQKDTETFYTFTSFTYPNTVFHLDMKTGKSELFRKPEVKFNPDDFVTEQVWYPSKDGTKVPMFVTYKKGLEKNGENPTFLYGYGGFNISLRPRFRVGWIAWLERGGIYAQPNLRGGGEFGEAWHEAGMLDRKQNVFDDFAWAAKHLVAEGYTRKGKLAVGGGSNGGLLVAATVVQNPELVQAGIAMVGVLDMLRFHKFTIGHAWVSEYGSADVAEQFPFLYAYSPLHNLKKGTAYPSLLITTADHDDRVVPAHSFKFAAAIQEAHGGDNPVLIRIETKAGHGAGKPTAKIIEEYADQQAFLMKELGAL